jgi:hypothetical protein
LGLEKSQALRKVAKLRNLHRDTGKYIGDIAFAWGAAHNLFGAKFAPKTRHPFAHKKTLVDIAADKGYPKVQT